MDRLLDGTSLRPLSTVQEPKAHAAERRPLPAVAETQPALWQNGITAAVQGKGLCGGVIASPNPDFRRRRIPSIEAVLPDESS